MTRRFGIYAKATPKQPRLTVQVDRIFFHESDPQFYDFIFACVTEYLRGLPPTRDNRHRQRPHLQSQSRPVVARLVRNRNRGAASGLAQ